MKKKLHFKLLLLLCAMIMGIGSAWADEVTIASFTASDQDHADWTINNSEYATAGGGYYKLISSDASIVTPSINWTEYSNVTITISARKFGGPDATQGKISVSQGENELASYSPSNTSIVASSALSISPVDGTITISCPGASSNKGCGVQSIVIKGNKSSGGQTQTVATPTFSPAAGTYTEVQNVTISTTTEDATIYYTVDGSDPTTSSTEYSSAITVSETSTIKAMAVKNGMNNSAVATATYIINLPYSGDGFVRISSLDDLTDGAKVIIAARYNTTANDYYAMTAAVTGKPTGVAFTSETTDKGEELPATILNNADTYYWTVEKTSDCYIFTNSSNQTLGYTSGTSFAEGGNNTTWGITRDTSGDAAMVSGYEGFYFTNKTKTDRGIALNNSYNYGPYSTTNNNSSTYNFYLDIFVEGATPVTAPSITANNVNLAYDSIEGSIIYTINNGVEGGTVSASTEAGWLTIGTVGETIPFTCEENTEATARTATVTLTYTYGDNETVTKDVTVTQAGVPVIASYSTIPELFAAATSTETEVNVTFDSWIVSGVSTNGKNVFVTDNNGNGFVIYSSSDMSNTYSAGSILSGTVSCKLKLFNGFAELLEVDASDLTIATGGTVSAANIALADLAGVNTGALVSYENLTCSVDNNKYYLSDGITTLQVYNSLYAFEALEDGKIYNITGIFQQYNNTKEILPRSAADIEEVEVQHEQYTLTVSNLNHVNTFVFDASEQNEMLLEGAGSISVYDGTSVLISVDVEQGYVLESLMVDGEDVTSQIDETGAYTFTMPTHDVTVTATAVEAPTPQPATTYTLATAIVPGKHYVFASGTNGSVYAMGKMKSTNREAVQVNANNGTIALTGEEGAYEFVINGPDTNGNYTIYDESELSRGYLYAAGGTENNHLKVHNLKDANSEWSISIDNNGVATIKAKMDGDENNRNWMRFNNGSNKLFSCYKSGQQDIYLFEKDGEDAPVETVTITTAKYATFCSEKAVDFSQTGITVYKAKANDDTKTVTFSAISEGIVPAYTGVILYKEVAGELSAPVSLTKGTSDWSDNEMVGTYERTMVERTTTIGDVTKYNYILQNSVDGIVFNRAKSANEQEGYYMPAGKAYLSTTVDAVESRMKVNIEGETTGINTINGEGLKLNGYYNLNGQRVDNPKKGLYIVNGKKVMVK